MKDVSRKVYFARCLGPTGAPIGAYKIGCSMGHNDRIKSVAANLPFSLELVATTPGSMVMEAICHLYLKEHRIAGEYFHECPPVDKFVTRVAETGRAFTFISDSGFDGGVGALVAPFMSFHGVTVEDICKYLGRPKSAFDVIKAGYKSRNLIAAVALIAAERTQHVSWPDNIIAALAGEVNPLLRDKAA